MLKRSQPVFVLLLALSLVAAACTSSGSDAEASAEAAPATTTESSAIEDTFVTLGNEQADTVIVVAQGGPIPSLETDEAQAIFTDLNLDDVRIALPHQVQTLEPERFTDQEVSFDEAKAHDMQTTQLIANVVEHFVDQDRRVIVVGISFGAFVVQDLLATQGNIADGYLIQVGRLDMPAEVWEPFSEGRFVGFIDGVEIIDVGSDGAGMGGDGDFTDANMARLAAGLGHNRYTELLADVDLSNVVYAYGELDEQVGRLTAAELAFLDAKGVEVLQTNSGHGETIDDTLLQGLGLLLGQDLESSEVTSDDDGELGYLPADQVEAYVAGFENGLATSSVTIDGLTLPVRYAGIESAITVLVDEGSVTLELGDDGLEGATVGWQGRDWIVQEEPDIAALPEPLGGDGDKIEMSFAAVADDGSSDTIAVGLDLDINIIGMGNSTVEVIDGYATISGTLGTSTYAQLSDVMASNPEVDTLVMLNVHGSENDEINVHTARLIRAAGWTTWVPSNGDISSGGVDMFVAGVERIVEPGGFVGVHSWGGGEGERTGRDYPKDSPVHRSQLEYFTEMMGDEVGADFYFYTLEASPFDQIYRMSPADMAQFGLITGDAPEALPASLIGTPAGYLLLAEGTYLKLQVASCQADGDDIEAALLSDELGPVELSTDNGAGELSIPALEGVAPISHDVTRADVNDGVASGSVDLALDALVDLDTSNARFEFPCAA